MTFSGRMGWSIGMTLPNMQEKPDAAGSPNILTVVEAKVLA